MDVQKAKDHALAIVLGEQGATAACLCMMPFFVFLLLFGSLFLCVPLCALWVMLFIYGHLPVKGMVDDSVRPRSESFQRSLAEQPQAFLSDETVGTSMFYKVVKQLTYKFGQWFHAFEIKGLENLPPAGKGALLISMHSTHNMDIPMGLTGLYETTGRVPRGLLHRIVFMVHPYCKYFGLIPGQRQTAKHLLQQGFLTCVLPGGGEEAMCGHENAYELHARWNDRRGFAHVAQEAGVDINPVFLQNVEEMRFNLFFFLCNRLGITRHYQHLVDMRIPGVSWFFKQAGMAVWFVFAYTGIPVPVKVTMFIGKAIHVGKEDSVDDVAEKSRLALQALIAEKQPHGHQYLPGLRERFDRLKIQ